MAAGFQFGPSRLASLRKAACACARLNGDDLIAFLRASAMPTTMVLPIRVQKPPIGAHSVELAGLFLETTASTDVAQARSFLFPGEFNGSCEPSAFLGPIL